MSDHEPGFDPVTLEIWWSRLVTIADESAAALVRTAFSTIVRESNDFATVLMDANGDSLAENTGGIASFSCILPRTTRHFLERFPRQTWQPGDCVITNDPWLATGHLPDITVVMPVFHRGRLVGFAGSVSHMADIGGAVWSADCSELFEEGLLIPPVQLFRAGERNDFVMELLLSNVRLPQQVRGDLEALIGACQVAGRRAVEFLEDAGMADFAGLAQAIHDRADTAMRQAVARVPDGTYRASVDADGYDADVTHIECAVTVKGTELTVDYAGTSPQIARGINSPMNYTHAYTLHSVKCALDPLTHRNEGSYRSLAVLAPEGSILNPLYPAPVGARQQTGLLVSGAVFRALAAVIPEQVIADSGSAPSLRAVFSGTDRARHRFSQVLFATGGMGATPRSDGLPTTCFPANAGAGSIEAFEAVSPLVVWRKELRTDSGGVGRFRGGLGQECVVENLSGAPLRLSLMADRKHHPAPGIMGGGPGAPSDVRLGDGTEPHLKARTTLPPDARISLSFPGGGGYGPAAERSEAAVANDVRCGYVSPEAAAREYRR